LECLRGWGLAEELGPERRRAESDRLWRQLTWYEFDEAVPSLSPTVAGGYRIQAPALVGVASIGRIVLSREMISFGD
jgi:hypothetical protein